MPVEVPALVALGLPRPRHRPFTPYQRRAMMQQLEGAAAKVADCWTDSQINGNHA